MFGRHSKRTVEIRKAGDVNKKPMKLIGTGKLKGAGKSKLDKPGLTKPASIRSNDNKSGSGGSSASSHLQQPRTLKGRNRKLSFRSCASSTTSGGSRKSKKKKAKKTTRKSFLALLALIETRKWSAVEKKLKEPGAKVYTTTKEDTGLTALGYALGHGAPLSVVRTLLELDPSATLKYDLYGAVPLHIACLNGASPDVIKLILDQDHGALAQAVDTNQRVPLHHAIMFACCQGRESRSQDLDVVKMLCEAAPEMVHLCDNKGSTAIDTLHDIKVLKKKHDAERLEKIDEVYSILKATSIRLYKEQKAKWEMVGLNDETDDTSSDYDQDATRSMTSLTSSVSSTSVLSRGFFSLEEHSSTGLDLSVPRSSAATFNFSHGRFRSSISEDREEVTFSAGILNSFNNSKMLSVADEKDEIPMESPSPRRDNAIMESSSVDDEILCGMQAFQFHP